MRLFPKTEKQLRKKGQPVDKRFCQHMRAPVFIQKTKVCIKQQCQQAKWEVSPWSRVSSAHSFFFRNLHRSLGLIVVSIWLIQINVAKILILFPY